MQCELGDVIDEGYGVANRVEEWAEGLKRCEDGAGLLSR